MKLRLVFIGVLISASLCSYLFADAGSMSLEAMLSTSQTIVLGRVNQVTVLNPSAEYPIKIAEVNILQVLKGDPSLKTVHYWVSPGLACDVTSANAGETDVFMFQPGPQFREYPRSLLKLLPKIKAFTGNRELARVVHSGRGQMEIKQVNGEKYVLGSKRDGMVRFPESLKMYDYPDPEQSYVGMIKVDDLLEFIQSYLRK